MVHILRIDIYVDTYTYIYIYILSQTQCAPQPSTVEIKCYAQEMYAANMIL